MMRGYIQKCLTHFDIDTTEPLQHFRENYVEVPVQWSEREWDSAAARGRLEESPLNLLAGNTPNPWYVPQPPYLALLVGPAGVGKSELIRQLSAYAAMNANLNLEVLPIKLVQCRWQSGMQRFPEENVSTDQFRDFLFTCLIDQQNSGVVGEFLDKVVLEDIHKGSVLLALDGVDEIIINRKQHDLFFRKLLEVLSLKDRGKGSSAKIILSCRLEYLRSLGVHHPEDVFGPSGGPGYTPGLHFLRLDFFNRSRIWGYLRRRGQFEQLRPLSEAPSGLADVMERPLFLKLLCDLREANPHIDVRTTSDVVGGLVETTLQSAPGAYVWDNDRLAAAALNLYKSRSASFRREDLRDIARRRGEADSETPRQIDPLEALHKCPFLRRDGQELYFTHKVFFDYFVARGMVQEVRAQASANVKRDDFARYLLTFEIRRFVRDFLGKEVWEEKTFRCFRLDKSEAEEWPSPEWRRASEGDLRGIAESLASYMVTGINGNDQQARTAIEALLAIDPGRLHPGFQMYCYEAVALFLNDHRWGREDQILERKFEKILARLIEKSMRRLPELPDSDPARDDLERLVFEILDIAYRLRLPQILKFAASRPGLSDVIHVPDTRNGTMSLLADIRALSPKAGRAAGH